jgi:hypothetical protein
MVCTCGLSEDHECEDHPEIKASAVDGVVMCELTPKRWTPSGVDLLAAQNALCGAMPQKCPDGGCDACIFDAPIDEFKAWLKDAISDT